MPTPIAPASLPGDISAEVLLRDLFDVSLTGIQVLRPVYAPDGGAVVDFTFVYTNPVGLRMIGLTQQPSGSIVAQFPDALATGILAYYQQAFAANESIAYETNYQADGIDNYLQFNAQRSGEQLLISFTDTYNQPRTVVEKALRASQARDRARAQQLEAARAEAEHERALLQALLAQAPVAIGLYTGEDLRVAAASALMADLLGRPLEQLVGQQLVAAAPELQGQGFDDELRQVMATQEPLTGTEIPVVTRRNEESQIIYTNSVYKPLYSSEKQVIGVLSVAVDVSEQVRARQQVEQLNQELEARVQQRTQQALALQAELLEAAQRQAQARESFYQIFEQTPAAVSQMLGPTHRFAYVNPVYQAVFAGRQLVGRDFADALPDAAEQGYLAMLDGVYQTGETFFGTEIPFVSEQPGASSHTVYFNFTYQAYRENGQVAGISSFAFDVTEQVLARRQIDEAAAELRLLTAHSPAFLFRTDAAGSLVYLNKSFFEWTGLDATRLRSLDECWEVVHSADLVEQQLGFVAAVQTGQPWQSTPYRFRRHDGQFRWMLSRSQPLFGPEGQILGHTGLTVEVHEQIELQRQLERTNVDLDTFIYTASHDLKAPITNIEGLLDALHHHLPAEVRGQELTEQLLAMMHGAVERFRATIDQLTDVARLQHDQDQPAEQIQLLAVIKDILLDLRPQLQSTRAQLTIEVGVEVHVLFSLKNLRSLVYNLLSNALKYHQLGQPPLVQLRASAQGQTVVFTVADKGLGLSGQQQTRLFGLFQRLHNHVEGTGVGLYMVKRIVENAGGTITVQSEVGVGTTFTVTLPTGHAR